MFCEDGSSTLDEKMLSKIHLFINKADRIGFSSCKNMVSLTFEFENFVTLSVLDLFGRVYLVYSDNPVNFTRFRMKLYNLLHGI